MKVLTVIKAGVEAGAGPVHVGVPEGVDEVPRGGGRHVGQHHRQQGVARGGDGGGGGGGGGAGGSVGGGGSGGGATLVVVVVAVELVVEMMHLAMLKGTPRPMSAERW